MGRREKDDAGPGRRNVHAREETKREEPVRRSALRHLIPALDADGWGRRPMTRPNVQSPSLWRTTLPLVIGAFLALTGWTWMRSGATAPLTVSIPVQLTTSGFEAIPACLRMAGLWPIRARRMASTRLCTSPRDDKSIKVTTNAGQIRRPSGHLMASVSPISRAPKEGFGLSGRSAVPRGRSCRADRKPPRRQTVRRSLSRPSKVPFAERAEMMTVPVTRGTPQRVTRRGSPRGGHRRPAWSSDGRRVAFSVFDGTQGLVAVDGTRRGRRTCPRGRERPGQWNRIHTRRSCGVLGRRQSLRERGHLVQQAGSGNAHRAGRRASGSARRFRALDRTRRHDRLCGAHDHE